MLPGAALFVVGKIWFALDPLSLPALYVNCVSTGVAVAITFVMFITVLFLNIDAEMKKMKG